MMPAGSELSLKRLVKEAYADWFRAPCKGALIGDQGSFGLLILL